VSLKCRIAATLLCALVVATDAHAQKRLALLIGINDYSASRIGARPHTLPVPGRDWPTLSGAVNDTGALAEMLALLYGFEKKDIVTLNDQFATRTAILQAIEKHLVKQAAKGDVIFFYYAGHGSQVNNSRSEELDRMDESIVPADSIAGAPDIRDKELQVLFNRIIDRGARLTIVLDNCHSGSGARGLMTTTRTRGVRADPRDVADGSRAPHPEARGALILSAAQDFDFAFETRDPNGLMHGAFTWALMRAMRDAAPGESGGDVFLRAQARLRAETPFQDPVLAGTSPARHRAFLGDRRNRATNRTVIAVEKVRRDGTVVLQGGWAHGLCVGSALRVLGERAAALTITAIKGLGRSEGRFLSQRTVTSGTLLEVAGWAAPSSRPLRVWMPPARTSIASLAPALVSIATQHRIRWITDPVEATPTHLLRPRAKGWELLDRDQRVVVLQNDAAAIAAVANLPPQSSLFVQFPAPAIELEDGIEAVARAEDADYILTGRYARTFAYAWVRPLVARTDRCKSPLPLRTEWINADADELRAAVLRLRRIQAWHLLETPPDARAPYRLALRDAERRDVRDGKVIGGNTYELLLRAKTTAKSPRYVYAFVIDSFGAGILLFPKEGSVENRFPLAGSAPADIDLGRASQFEVVPPYGVDTYFLLTTDEPLPDTSVLSWNGVRARSKARPPLEQLRAMPPTWSLEKMVIESVAP
jgi:hypothetical protein